MKFLRTTLAALLLMGLPACKSESSPPPAMPPVTAPAETSALQTLLDGNQRFVQGHPIHPQQSIDRRTEVSAGQKPIAIVVSCSDSRVPPEIVFDQGLGDLFVVRVAGNVVNDEAIGSIEYAVDHLHCPLIIVLGHDNCGAVKAAIGGEEAEGHIQSLVDAIQPAVAVAKTKQGDLLDNAIDANVQHVVQELKTSKPILAHLQETGEIQVVAARYSMASGAVKILPDH